MHEIKILIYYFHRCDNKQTNIYMLYIYFIQYLYSYCNLYYVFYY